MISTHILDTTKGMPAADVAITLSKKDSAGKWIEIGSGKTNTDGRLAFDCPKEKGSYSIHFKIEEYFKTLGSESFFLNTDIAFHITNTDRKYHVPLLLNPYGYTTYRGS